MQMGVKLKSKDLRRQRWWFRTAVSTLLGKDSPVYAAQQVAGGALAGRKDMRGHPVCRPALGAEAGRRSAASGLFGSVCIISLTES